jgi:hypothetical protein
MITECTSFRGCWQLVFHAALSPAAAQHLQHAEAATGSSMDEQMRQLASEVLLEWPGWELQQVETLAAAGAAAAAAAEEDDSGYKLGAALARQDAGSEPVPAAGTAAVVAGVSWADASAGPGLFLTPVAVAASSSSRGVTQDAPTAAASSGALVDLCISGGAVQQLLSGGRSKLRVVVSDTSGPPQRQSSSSSSSELVDQEWDLQHLAASATAAVDAVALDAVAHGDRAEAAEHDDVHNTNVCLQLDLGSAVCSGAAATAGAAAEVARVYQVVVIAAPCSSASTSASTAGNPGARCLVAYLPLLVLPAAARQELQQLFDAAVAAGLTCSAAYQQLLPMLQDWATILLWPGSSSSSSTTSRHVSTAAASQEGNTAQQEQELSLHVLSDALSASFAEFNMEGCLALLTQRCERLQQQQQQVRQEAVQGVAHDSRIAAAPMGESTSSSSSMLAVPGCSSDETSSSSSSMLAASDCSSDETSPAIEQHTPLGCSEDGKPQGKAAVSSSCSPDESTAATAAANAQGRAGDHLPLSAAAAAAAPLSAYRVSWQTIMFGFCDAAVQREYVTYRSTELKVQDYGVTLFYSIGCVAMLCKAVMLMASSNAAAAQQLRVLAIKGSMVFFNWLPCLLLWLAAKWHSGSRASALQLRVGSLLRQRRGGVLIAGFAVELVIVHACHLAGGAWSAAMDEVAQQYYAVPALLAIHLHVVQPLLFRAGPGTTTAYAALCRLFIESVYPRPTIEVLRWLSYDAVSVLFASCGVWLAAVLERSQQHRFVSTRVHAARVHAALAAES